MKLLFISNSNGCNSQKLTTIAKIWTCMNSIVLFLYFSNAIANFWNNHSTIIVLFAMVELHVRSICSYVFLSCFFERDSRYQSINKNNITLLNIHVKITGREIIRLYNYICIYITEMQYNSNASIEEKNIASFCGDTFIQSERFDCPAVIISSGLNLILFK